MLNYKMAGLVALVTSMLLLSSWELYWRSQGRYPDIDDNKALWAVERGKVSELDSRDVILTGSSRVHFDVQLDVWNEAYGRKPLQLAYPGSVPLPIVADIVKNTEFNGTLVIGVAPGLFWGEVTPDRWSWKRAQSKVDHYFKRTLADRLNHQLGIPFQENFVFVASSEEEWDDDIDLRTLLKQWTIGDREGDGRDDPFYRFDDITLDRNVTMKTRMETDTAFARTVQLVWHGGGLSREGKHHTCDVIDYLLPLLDQFKARGGRPIFLRCPSDGEYITHENKYYQRDSTWEVLLYETSTPGIYFEDYEELTGYVCPEWSHLSAPDARQFTKDLVSILQKEGLLETLNEE